MNILIFALTMPGSKFYQKIHSWRLRHISPRNFILLLSLIAGILGGLAVSTPPPPYFLAKARFLPLEQKSIYDKQSKAGYHVCQG
jgi:hypothetical protein